jgi:hypothetical protein
MRYRAGTLLLCTLPFAPLAGPPRDGQHDFDFSVGTWTTHIKRRPPLTGSTTWTEYTGAAVTRKVWDGRASVEEIEADGPAGHLEGVNLRLYDPKAHQWSLSFASSAGGSLSVPMIGEFRDGRGEFLDQESYNGRTILVRQIWSDITPNSYSFEEAFSDDNGKTWEPNWIAKVTRNSVAAAPAASTGDGAHDFDFDFGTWKTHTSRLQHPLTGSSTWTEMDGITVVHKVWNGRANLAELESDGPTGHLSLLSLRLYDPQAHQWNLNFATSAVGIRSVPMIGEFKNGRGEFYDQEPFNGRTILVRFTMQPLGRDSARSEQAFSNDGGKTWEVNWINRYSRVKDATAQAN